MMIEIQFIIIIIRTNWKSSWFKFYGQELCYSELKSRWMTEFSIQLGSFILLKIYVLEPKRSDCIGQKHIK